MEGLPDEILFEIFDFCERLDLLSLTLVCRRYNELISNNTHLMKTLPIDIRRNHDNSNEWNGTRRYSQISIHKMHREVPRILEAMRNDLTYMRLMKISMDATHFKQILLSSPKLVKLGIMDVDFNFGDGCFDEPLPRLELETLACGSDRNILRMLMHSQTKYYTSYRVKAEPGEFEALRSFMKVQKKMDKIHFFSFNHDAQIFDDETLNEVDFRLKILAINNIRDVEIQNFKKFLQNHHETLTHMEIRQLSSMRTGDELYVAEILNLLTNFPNLKSLLLHKIYFSFQPMPYIEKLHLSIMGYGESSLNWSEKFPNVKNLCLQRCEKVNEIMKLQKLETLHLEDLEDLDGLKIPPTIKNFQVYNIVPRNDYPFNFENHQIENFVAEQTIESDWIGNFLRSLNEKLKFLRIERCFLSRNRRFSRMFEKHPDLMHKAERFIFIDWKDEYDEDSIISEAPEWESDGEEIDDFIQNCMLYEYEEECVRGGSNVSDEDDIEEGPLDANLDNEPLECNKRPKLDENKTRE